MTRAGRTRERLALVVTSVLLAWVGGSGHRADDVDVTALPTHDATVEAIPSFLLAPHGRPVLSPYSKHLDNQRWSSVAIPARVAVDPAAVVVGIVPSSPFVLSTGPVARGLSGRDPPASDDR